LNVSGTVLDLKGLGLLKMTTRRGREQMITMTMTIMIVGSIGIIYIVPRPRHSNLVQSAAFSNVPALELSTRGGDSNENLRIIEQGVDDAVNTIQSYRVSKV
jgi:hypothetical protein